MAMSCTATVTGKTGAAQTVTTKVVTNVSQMLFDIAGGTLRVYTGGPQGGGTLAIDIGMDSFSSIAGTASSGAFTFTIS
jgi:hypothetical protein